jgi:hypothetical protein
VLIRSFAAVYLKVKFKVSSPFATHWLVEGILVQIRLRRRSYKVDSTGRPYSRTRINFVGRVIDVNALEQCPEGT